MRILLVDDERELALILARFLEKWGHQVETVTTGGLDVLPAYDRFQPDMVLMDVMMPRFNGITISHALRSRNQNLPIVLLSGKLTIDHPFVRTSGATHFLPKPVQFPELETVLREIEAGLGGQAKEPGSHAVLASTGQPGIPPAVS